jgi:RES domain-containing protein
VILWRISRHLDLTGAGGLRIPGRWHHIGNPVVYFASSPAAAMLEVCVHTSANDIPPSYTLLKVSFPDELTTLRVEDAQLADHWQSSPEVTRDLGTRWLRSNASALLAVPSAIIPETINMLLNPFHPQAGRCTILAARSYPFDTRLKR